MKIQLLSDVHLEVICRYKPVATDADVVVLAGDIGIFGMGLAWARESFSCPVLYVPGNHEYYRGNFPQTLDLMRELSCDRVQLLDHNAVIIDGVRFLGLTGWTDFSATKQTESAFVDAAIFLNDFRQITVGDTQRDLYPGDIQHLNALSYAWLQSQLVDDFSGKTVVISHYAPSLQSLEGFECVAGRLATSSELKAAYANDWDSLMDGGKIALWMHGHFHRAVDYCLNGTRIVSNPLGYGGVTGESLRNGFRPHFTLTV